MGVATGGGPDLGAATVFFGLAQRAALPMLVHPSVTAAAATLLAPVRGAGRGDLPRPPASAGPSTAPA